jgi:RNA polymerase sigma-70 factor (ECF subfamily)
MKENALDTLLDRLTQGDARAAEDVFVAYEPYLRMVVRRQLSRGLRAKFDSVDIVQSVWADLLSGFRDRRWTFQDADHLRAFLVEVTKNRFIDRLRQHAAAMERERPLSAGGMDALAEPQATRPSQLAQAGELWDQMVAACPPAHLDILQLKRHGCSLDEIAAQTGFHKNSVRRILYELARRMTVKHRNASRG